MMKKSLAALAMLFAFASHAAVDANKGSAADLEAIKGIGPKLSQHIVETRKSGEFKSWADFSDRVRGVGPHSAAKLSAEGLTVNGQSYKAATAQPAASKAPAVSKTAAK